MIKKYLLSIHLFFGLANALYIYPINMYNCIKESKNDCYEIIKTNRICVIEKQFLLFSHITLRNEPSGEVDWR